MPKTANIVDLAWERARQNWNDKTKNAGLAEALSNSEEKDENCISFFFVNKEETLFRPSKEFEWKSTLLLEMLASFDHLHPGHKHKQSNLHSDFNLVAKTKENPRSTCHFVKQHASSSSTRIKHLAHEPYLNLCQAALKAAQMATSTHEQLFPRPPVRPMLPGMTTAKTNLETRLAKAISTCEEIAGSQDTGERLALAIDLEAQLGRLEPELASQGHPLTAEAVSLLRDALAFQYAEKLTLEQWDVILSSLRVMHSKRSSLSRVEVNEIHNSLLDAGLSTLPFTDKAEALLPDDD